MKKDEKRGEIMSRSNNYEETAPIPVVRKNGKRKKNRWLKRSILLVLVIILVFAGIYIFNLANSYFRLTNKLENSNGPSATSVENVSMQPFSILFMGQGTNGRDGEDEMADSITLAVINPVKGYAEIFSIPRDSYLPRGKACDYAPGYFDKVTHTKNITCLESSMEELFDFDINYYVTLDFNGFISIVNALGGVEMNVPDLREGFNYFPGAEDAYLPSSLKDGQQWCEHNSNRDPYAICFRQFGPQIVDGEQALALARSRHYDSDFARSDRQSELIKAIIQKASSAGGLMSASGLLDAISDSVTTNIAPNQFLDFANLGKTLLAAKSGEGGTSFTIRTTQLAGASSTFDGDLGNASYNRVYASSIEDIREKIAFALNSADMPLTYTSFDYDIDGSAYDTTAYMDGDFLKDTWDVSDPYYLKKFNTTSTST